MIYTLRFFKILILITILQFCVIESYAQNVINGKVWLDYDADGSIDGFDPGIAQVPVFLLTCSGQFLQSTLTNGNGDYIFNNIPDGSYKIFFNKSALASNYAFTRIGSGYDNSALANGYTYCSLVNDDNTFNAGLTVLSSIGDQVWEDMNGNGLREPSEPGIANVLINLYNDDDFLVAQTMTNAQGKYNFENIFPDIYYLEFLPNPTYRATKQLSVPTYNNSDISDNTGRNLTNVYEIFADQIINDIDAGFYRCAEICGNIYYDENGDHLFQGTENGINNLEIQIWQKNVSDSILYDSQLTHNDPNTASDDGYYSFCVPPGDYFLKLIIPSGVDLYPGLPLVGIDPTIYNHINQINGLNTTSTKSVISGSQNCDINNGLSCRGEIVVTVWLDENRNGIREGGETLLNDIRVVLYNNDRTEIKTVITDAQGKAHIDSIPRGQYYIYTAASIQYMFTQPLATNDPDIDSDIQGVYGYGTTNTIDLGNCQKINNIGAGVALRPLPVVWGDSWVKTNERYNLVHWEAKKEINSDKYMVYRSSNGVNGWSVVGELKAKNNGQSANYEITDIDYYKTMTYYKIVAFDYDGKSFESGILWSERQSQSQNSVLKMVLLPNPSSSVVQIQLDVLDNEMSYNIKIIDGNGRLISSQQLSKVEADNTLDISALTNGSYYVLLIQNDRLITKEILIVQK